MHDFTPITAVPDYTLVPQGGTALLDAIGFALTEEGAKLSAMLEEYRPGKVIVVIVTDGQENSSREYKRQAVKDMITTQQDKYGWQVTYIGANQDSFAEAGGLGIPLNSTLDYAATDLGTDFAWRGAAAASAGYSAGTTSGIFYSTEQRDAAKDNA